MVSLSKHRNKFFATFGVLVFLLTAFYLLNWPWMHLGIMMRAYEGDSIAQYKLGRIYSQGNGYSCARRNEDTALKWYSKAAEKDHPEALYEVGRIYQTMGIKFDDKSPIDLAAAGNTARENAKPWLVKAAEKNHKKAQWQLGQSYIETSDLVNAYIWITLSREKAITETARREYFNRVTKPSKIKITEAEVRKAEKFIKKWKPLPAPPPIDDSDLRLPTGGWDCLPVPHRCRWLVWLVGY